MLRRFTLSLALCTLLVGVVYAKEEPATLRLATTTSTENSGLLSYLLPDFEKKSGLDVHTIAVGTGKALRMGRDGDVDVLLVHAPGAEKDFISAGYGIERVSVMYNDFVIVGPKDDPARLGEAKTISEALQKIAADKSLFLSRGDDSGTHKKELKLWNTSQTQTDGRWYREAGQGMGKVLMMAGELDAYTLTDRGTWLALRTKLPLEIAFQGDKQLFNPYSAIAVNPDKHPDLNTDGAKQLIQWLVSDETQRLISEFTVGGKQLFIPDASKTPTTQTQTAAVAD